MRAQGSGRVVMNSSVLGLAALPWRGAYIATKFALEGLTDTLRLELRGSGVAVVLIEPGPIATPFRAKSVPRFERWIDWRASPHARGLRADPAQAALRAVGEEGPLRAAALGGDRQADPRAGEPATRRRATTSPRRPTSWAALKRLLPTRLLDALAARL